MRAASELGLRTVAVYSHEDRFSLHRTKADEAYLVGRDKGPVEAYLDITDILRIAREARVDAIHPGYGFLAENPEFAQPCAAAGIIFVGPAPATLRLLGNKVAARELAVSAGVAVMPATAPLPQDAAACAQLAQGVGYPLMLKASWGGGGRGMRVVENAAQLAEARAASRGARRTPPSATTRCTWRSWCGARATSRCRSSATSTARSCTCTNATARRSGATRRWWSARRRCFSRRRSARSCARRRCDRARRRLPQRRHGGVPAGRRQRPFLLHRGESAHPGGTHRDGVRDRRRPRQGADPHRGRRAHRYARKRRAAAGTRSASARTRCSAASPPRIRKTTSFPTTARSAPTAVRPASACAWTPAPPTPAPSSRARTTRCW